MKIADLRILMPVVWVLFSGPIASAQDAAEVDSASKVEVTPELIGYFLGISQGQQLRRSKFTPDDFDFDRFLDGFRRGIGGKDPEMSDDQLRATGMFLERLVGERIRIDAEKRLAEGRAYLAKIAKQEGVKKLPGGLLYKVIESGDGKVSPGETDTVQVQYTGKFIDGRIFDTSRTLPAPAKFRLNQVIKGWTIALQQMKPGDRWQLFVPPELAYGPPGNQNIPPNATLTFDVELLSVQ